MVGGNNNGSMNFVGSFAMNNYEDVFTRLSEKLGPYLFAGSGDDNAGGLWI